ncbi:putative TIR domain, P-loop containing nucleoside triphosphate hydrolase [Rosa chinensis]|uniref:ADP-ribosyl cyclase/cyclic ADP-ribose hydrolase n=1 Tax=Rosa chinensis TaxID=74649 RepID=A0A2P6PSA3_ROSCH|nr:TMV resistance protein N [Rosa chinensis]XP_024161963.1 TMV resistance protein N [Rosa chinensis]XP_040365096.1 TMV resistance protein N [Rosa chinensis]PRQ24817.1 putative TIR domain, P-loop containing nucleoside triphosphate hydrolase [Rosa chinensis]
MAFSTQRSLASLPPAESGPRWKHDVFLSFRGEDTRKGFTSHLYHELHYWQAIKTFKDDRELDIGSRISPELLSAIRESQLAIVVLSPHYASSTWCLDELTKIIECMEARNAILPIFYEVNPSDVRKQRGSFAEAFTMHEEKFGEVDAEKVKQWRVALTKAANLSGWDSKNYKSERELIEDIVKYVWRKVHPNLKLLDSTEPLVGIDSTLQQLGLLLAQEANDVRFIGIWGMGGIGKTTIAKLVFQKISHHFELAKFLTNVREVSARHGTLVDLQKQLLSPMLKESITEVYDEMQGTLFTKNCLSNKKVLLVLDDVDQVNQLEKLAKREDWFGAGSRVIITTRDERLLVEHGIELIYKVEGLNDEEALELFSQNAFQKDQYDEGLLELSKSFVNYARGLPLALKVLGRSLYKRGRDEWISALGKLKKSPGREIFTSLKISYDRLDETDKDIFLDVAFFHKGKDKEELLEILDKTYDFSSLLGINVLIEKSLLTISKSLYNNSRTNVEMHDLIQEMAWEIVRQESPDEPGRRSRLCHHMDIFHVFINNSGTQALKGIVLRLPELEKAYWNCEAFSKMSQLRYVEFQNVNIPSGPSFLPKTLITLKWSWYPSKCLPYDFQLHFLTELKMPKSNLVQLWEGAQDLPNLKYLDLVYSENLTKTPDFTRTPNLKELVLRHCTDLVEIHPSIAMLKRLERLDLSDCTSITSLPTEFETDSLKFFSVKHCSKLKKIPEFGEQMKNLLQLWLSGTAIVKVPSSIDRQVGLKYLQLHDCESLLCLPNAICNLKFLLQLDISRCSKFEKLPENLGKMESLEYFRMNETSITDLPPSLSLLKDLQVLECRGSPIKKQDGGFWGLFVRKSPEPLGLVLHSLNGLRSLKQLDLSDCNICQGGIPDDIGCLSFVQQLDLSGNNFVTLPSSIKRLSNLHVFRLQRCQRLQQVPDLPSTSSLHISADDCISLVMLPQPSELRRSSIKSRGFSFTSANCFGLVDNEGCNNGIFSMLRRLASQGISTDYGNFSFNIVSPGSKISEWFAFQNEGDSLIVELPLPDSWRSSKWMGLAFCVMFADDPAASLEYDYSVIECSSEGIDSLSWQLGKKGNLVKDHFWVFYLHRQEYWNNTTASSHIRFSLQTYCRSNQVPLVLSIDELSKYGNLVTKGAYNVKKCGARLVFEDDLDELLNGTMNNILQPTSEYCDEEESGPGRSGISDNEYYSAEE